ncbi:hypothetical protein PSTG_15948 [Puccinia striiformis f. sp. tritici PST-78]|uniref:Uncharacterized protein n=1 Tax=Puccinia striiformis f. sp. tritici PST-78 TaxID=1165861 RepID=A0A0L0UUD3_9BASI|nr:hypothetical protein PSTG_15948 [Puccinia striiformis f. sp. tritici PST-78]
MSINFFHECSAELEAIDHKPASKLLSMDKQLAIFLYIVGQNATNRQTQDRFQHSGETILKVFHHIIFLILQLRWKYIVAPDPKFTHEIILDNPKFSPFFNSCLGTMDGCHVHACVPEHLAGPYRNRKGTRAQNVLGVVDFDMKFTYLMVGWEGSAHDSRVLGSALSEDFHIPQLSFYLADAGYALTRGTLIYQVLTYCIDKQTRDKGGVIQSAPLNDAKQYSLKTQRDLVLALAVLHNMIIEHTCEPLGFVIDPDEDGAPTGKDDLPPEEEEELTHSQRRERARNNAWRDQMAQDMWTQYQEYLQSLGCL